MRVGCIGYATEQGLGRLAKSFYDAGVITDMMIFQHPNGRPTRKEWYPKGTPILTNRPFSWGVLEDFLEKIDVLLCFETPFDWTVLPRAHIKSVRTVLIPMYEWYLRNPPHQFQHFINPSLLDQDYFPQGTFIPIPVDYPWTQRTVAKRFLHNAGHIGSRYHKGTMEVLQAVKYLKTDLHLTIRSQETDLLKRLVVQSEVDRSRVTIEGGEKPYQEMFDGFDVLVAPEKYNGLSLPLQEARAAGMCVLTTNRYPTNSWLPEPLIPVKSNQMASVDGGHLEFNESIVDPEMVAECMDKLYSQDISQYSLEGRKWAEEHSWEVLKPRYMQFLESIV